MERIIAELSEDELREALREALRLPEGPPPGVKHWTMLEMAELFGVNRQVAAEHAAAAVNEGRLKRVRQGQRYVYWFTEGK